MYLYCYRVLLLVTIHSQWHKDGTKVKCLMYDWWGSELGQQ